MRSSSVLLAATAALALGLGSGDAASATTPTLALGSAGDAVGDSTGPAGTDLAGATVQFDAGEGNIAVDAAVVPGAPLSSFLQVLIGTRDASGACNFFEGTAKTYVPGTGRALWDVRLVPRRAYGSRLARVGQESLIDSPYNCFIARTQDAAGTVFDSLGPVPLVQQASFQVRGSSGALPQTVAPALSLSRRIGRDHRGAYVRLRTKSTFSTQVTGARIRIHGHPSTTVSAAALRRGTRVRVSGRRAVELDVDVALTSTAVLRQRGIVIPR